MPELTGHAVAFEKKESRQSNRKDRRVAWIAHGKRCSVEFWVQVGAPSGFDRQEFRGEPCWAGGFEVHSRHAFGYSPDDKPSGESCQILGGKCWHDGSSLSAPEFFETWDQQDASAFAECERWLEDRDKEEE